MRKNHTKTISVIFLVLILMMTVFVGCGDKDNASSGGEATSEATSNESTPAAVEEEVIGDIKVTLSIDFPDSGGQPDVEDKEIGLTSDSSVLDALFAYGNENNIDVLTEGEDDLFVTSIGGVANEGNSGWIYTVNDNAVMESAGKAVLQNGSDIEWEYSTLEDDED